MMKQQQHKWLFSSSKRKANQKRSRRSGWFSIFLTVAAVGLGLWCAHSLAELVHVQRVLQQTLRGRDTKSVTEQWQAVKKKLEGGHEELAELKQRHQALKSELEIAEATLLKEKENCKFELQNLEMEWKVRSNRLHNVVPTFLSKFQPQSSEDQRASGSWSQSTRYLSFVFVFLFLLVTY